MSSGCSGVTMDASHISISQDEPRIPAVEMSSKAVVTVPCPSSSADDTEETIERGEILADSAIGEREHSSGAPIEETKEATGVDIVRTDEPMAVSKPTKSLSKEELASVSAVRETPRSPDQKQQHLTSVSAGPSVEGSHMIPDTPRYAYPIRILPMRPKNALLWPSASAALEKMALHTQRQRSSGALSESCVLHEGSTTPRQDTARLLVSPFRGLYQVTHCTTPRYVASDSNSVWLRLNAEEVLAVESPARLLEERRAGAPWRAPAAFKLTPVRNANGLTAGAALDALAAAALGFCGASVDILEDVATGTEYTLVRVAGSKRLAIKRWGDGCRLFYVQPVDSSGGKAGESALIKESDNPEQSAEEELSWPPLYNKSSSGSLVDDTVGSEKAHFTTPQYSITSTSIGALDRLLSTPRQLEIHSPSASLPPSYSLNEIPFQGNFAKTPSSELFAPSEVVGSSCYAPSVASVSTVTRQPSSNGPRRCQDRMVTADRESFWNQVKQRLIKASSAAAAPFTAC